LIIGVSANLILIAVARELTLISIVLWFPYCSASPTVTLVVDEGREYLVGGRKVE